MTSTRWAVVDTETDGLFAPIHVVEIAAQLMQGWNPVGQAFRVLLNHDVPIPPEVVAVHGYTRSFLREHGLEPRRAHEQFRDYLGDVPLVAHNLSFDWDRCLEPEWGRLGIAPFARRGFCSMLLCRRVIPETRSHRLSYLKEHFGLAGGQSHRALNDGTTTVELIRRVLQPKLSSAGLETFEAIARFSRHTPVRKCWEQIHNKEKQSPREAGAGLRLSPEAEHAPILQRDNEAAVAIGGQAPGHGGGRQRLRPDDFPRL